MDKRTITTLPAGFDVFQPPVEQNGPDENVNVITLREGFVGILDEDGAFREVSIETFATNPDDAGIRLWKLFEVIRKLL